MASKTTDNTGRYKAIVLLICTIAALGGLLFGLDQGFIANSLSTIEKTYHLGLTDAEYYSAILATGGVVGAMLSGLFARFLGRKKSLILAGFLFATMSLLSACLPPFGLLCACRFALGFAVGVASFIVPLYLSETAPPYIRGSMGTLFQLMITIGIFLISLTNIFIAKVFIVPTTALPIMFLVISTFALIMLLGSFILPESPRWLMLKGKKAKAVKVLNRILDSDEEIHNEIYEIEQAIGSSEHDGIKTFFQPYFLKILIIGVTIMMFQQLVGINMMIYYAPRIFSYAKMQGLTAMMAVPTCNMLFTLPAIWLVEKWGRKKMLYVGSIIMFISMFAAGTAFLMLGKYPNSAAISEISKAVLLVSAIVYIFGFAFSWGPVGWLICSEIFPIEGREVGLTITTMVNWAFGGLVMANALTFMRAYGNYSIFYVFGGFCVLSILFLRSFVPETKGISLEKLEYNLKNGSRLCEIGNVQAS